MSGNAYIFGRRKAGAKENVLSQERLEQIKQNVKFIRSVPADTLKPACPQCINLAECLALATDPSVCVKCIWYGWLLDHSETLKGGLYGV